MSGQRNKWAYANYAAQSLAALLAPDDELAVIRMRAPFDVEQLEIVLDRRQESILNIKSEWGANDGTKTPFDAVKTAMGHSEKKFKLRKDLVNDDGPASDWLVIMTDGEFQGTPSVPEEVYREFMDQVGGKVRTIFLLIGNGAEKTIPNNWKKIAPIDIFTAKTEGASIVNAMSEIAALVMGRDRRGVDAIIGQNGTHTVTINSPFPVRRITVFQQSEKLKLNDVQRISCDSCPVELTINEFSITLPPEVRGKSLNGRVSLAAGQGIMPAGIYTIQFKDEPEIDNMVVVVETAVDFSVELFGAGNVRLTPEAAGGIYRLCRNDDLSVVVKFLESGSRNVLPIGPISGSLEAKALLGHDQYVLQAELTSNSLISHLKVPESPSPLSIEARYPGYFHLKSNILTIEPEDCNLAADFSLKGDNSVSVPYTSSDNFIPADVKELLVKGNAPDGIYHLEVSGIPKGIELHIQGEKISPSENKADLHLVMGKLISFEVLENNNYRATDPQVVLLTFSTQDSHVQIGSNKISLSVYPKKRMINILPGQPWKAQVDQLSKDAPSEIRVFADGQPVTPAEFENWHITRKDGCLDVNLGKLIDKSAFTLAPKYKFGCACFTPTGEIPLEFDIMGPYPDEHQTYRQVFSIIDIPWWQKCFPLICYLIIFLFLTWWILGMIRKPRFGKGSMIVFQRSVDYSKGREDATDLPGNFFYRWILPYRAERKTVEAITFVAGDSPGHVVILSDQQDDNMTVNGIVPGDPGDRDWFLGNNETLEIRRQNRLEKYTYQI